MLRNSIFTFFAIIAVTFIFIGCGNNSNQKVNNDADSISMNEDTTADSNQQIIDDTNNVSSDSTTKGTANLADKSTVLIYNFHITNRCVSCIAIEDATTKTLNNYFATELKQGRIKRQILNVDDDANKTISEKYQAFGSGLFVTRVFKGKETTTDLTGDGFKYAKNKEEKFIEILKNKITEYLK